MNQHYDAFRKKLQEIFMMDHAELDFGIYRIMNHKRKQINDFLDNQLLPQVEQTLKEYVKTDDSLQQELNKAIEGCKNLGIDPDTNPKVQQLREQIAQSSTYRIQYSHGLHSSSVAITREVTSFRSVVIRVAAILPMPFPIMVKK